MKEKLTIEHYPQLLNECGLPENTPREFVIDLLERLQEKNISASDTDAVEQELQQSKLWAWAQGEEDSLSEEVLDVAEELHIASWARRIAQMFGA